MRGPIRLLLPAVLPVALVVGCGGPQFGAEARVPQEARHIIQAGSPADHALRLPGDRGFNIHIKQGSQDLGSTGQARGEADADAKGHAFAQATAARGGSGKAEFKIGHRIDNLASTGQTMAAQITFNLKQTVKASDPPAPGTLAKADLFLLVVDSRRRLASKTVIVQANSDDSIGTAALPQQRDLTVQLEPGESYDVVLFGQVEAAADDAQHATARVEIEQLQMVLTFSPVTTTQPAPQAAQAAR
jgi:hypothetical protein